MAQFGNGVTWRFDPDDILTGSPSYGTAIDGVVGLDLSGPSTDLLDSTVHGETWRTRVSGLKDGGTASITVRFETNDATHKAIRDAVGVLCAHKFTFPLAVSTNSTPFSWANDAIIQNYSISAPHDGLLEMNVTLQLSGPPTFVEEAA
jgi:predicted secreted protein